MTKSIEIVPIDPCAGQLQELADEARASGYKFMDRLILDAKSGRNRFDQEGGITVTVYLIPHCT